jgi:hypothetical protein
MVKEGALVINCGTTFSPAHNRLLPDVHDEVAKVARFLTPTPHGVGPTCAAALTLNTLTLAEAAARRRHLETHHKVSPPCADLVKEVRDVADIPEGWTQGTCARTGSPLIRRTFLHASFRQAAQFIADMTGAYRLALVVLRMKLCVLIVVESRMCSWVERRICVCVTGLVRYVFFERATAP